MRRVLTGCSSCSSQFEGLGCNRSEDFNTPVSSGSNMGSVARFPKLDECAHFHYEHVELTNLEVSITEVPNDTSFAVRVTSGDTCWTLQRSYENFIMFDRQLHRCIFDRKFSSLAKLPEVQPDYTQDLLAAYLKHFSNLNHDGLNCGPVLNWLQLDNRGRRILVPESDSCPINTPAVAAAYAVRPYTAQAQDEISFLVGDMISVIDMPPPGESNWWRGKKGFAVGFFPAECVAVIGDKVPRHLTVSNIVRSKLPVKPVLRKHGKLIAFFRSFILNRPSRRRLKQSGILKERVFGCDLGEHLLNSGQDVPAVLKCCAEFIETHGLVDGIYRLSGVTSNIQRLRHAFDEDRVPALHSDESILQDIHSVASLLKMYFRELPNPLCTYQLYFTFVTAVQANTDADRLRRMRDAVRKLPPPHYRTLEYLMRHLVRVAACGADTGMTPRNVAIVWAPNLLRCKELEVGGVAALQGVGVQAVVTEFLICYAELIFGDGPVGRPKSLAITTPARLLSLEEARNRTLRNDSEYIEVGAGPAGLPVHYHTVIELPRKRNGSKRSPSLNWRAIFGRGGFGARGKTRQVRTPPQNETIPSSFNAMRRLRPVKSADSLDGEDSLGPLMGPLPNRPCGHSRSVSHDSYFDHLADAPSSVSPLDLSEIQINFDLEEREMRMFSEEESGGVVSVEASPRRQRNEGPLCIAVSGGSKRKRSRLEERLHCDVELRFIDSQSPDQIMVSADIHGMETPSPLTTPGYLPLLSEASTPISPSTLQATPISIAPKTGNSPRINFRSFTLPLDLDGQSCNSQILRRDVSSDKLSLDPPSQRLSVNLDNRSNAKSYERVKTYEIHGSSPEIYDMKKTSDNLTLTLSDQEIKSSDILNLSCAIQNDVFSNVSAMSFQEKKSVCNSQNSCDELNQSLPNNTQNSENDGIVDCLIICQNEPIGMPSSSTTDLDSPMSCEQIIEELPDSGFVLCDDSDQIFTNADNTQALATNTNDSGEWVMVERTVDSVTTSTNEVTNSKDQFESTFNSAIGTNHPLQQSCASDLTMGSTPDIDRSCNGPSDLIDSSILVEESTSEISFDISENKNDKISSENENNLEKQCGSDLCNGNDRCCSESAINLMSHLNSAKMDHVHECCSYSLRLDNENLYRCNLNESSGVMLSKSSIENNHLNYESISSNKDIQYNRTSQYSSNIERKNSIDDKECSKRCKDTRHSLSHSSRKSQPINQHIYLSQHAQETIKRSSNTQIRDNEEVVIQSENAAEAHEIAHDPEGASETTSLDSSYTFSNASSPIDESAVLRDTAAILQELALQRLSGGVGSETPLYSRNKHESDDCSRNRGSFDLEINSETDTEINTKLEDDCLRGKSEEKSNYVTQYLPPCLRARQARATRAALSRSLDEDKFNRMTSESTRMPQKQLSDDSQHNSTPNVGVHLLSCSQSTEKLQSRNLGLDLGDPRCRERIEKYKEERRVFLRDKYRSESFRGSTSRNEDDGELLARLKQRATRPLH
ncbi:rho GTPase-activating protein 32 isoform X2 [Microplitis demolitor]|uniref:rho GTPase-activating protein 32 isoform X2 n=1 Tax=Microplitis demolitor TaxID=69319 RepID=UPI0004CC9C56|nr:rho GTPase-activating protein 32 isoform X2 [Microplitis demolitor]